MTEEQRKIHTYMQLAMEQAELAATREEVPVGAIIVDRDSGDILACAGNRVEELADPTAHAELLAIREAGRRRGRPRLVGCDLYVSLEPCAMCATALSFARINAVYFAASDPKGGGILAGPRIFEQPTCHHRPEVHQIEAFADQSAALLKAFFRARR